MNGVPPHAESSPGPGDEALLALSEHSSDSTPEATILPYAKLPMLSDLPARWLDALPAHVHRRSNPQLRQACTCLASTHHAPQLHPAPAQPKVAHLWGWNRPCSTKPARVGCSTLAQLSGLLARSGGVQLRSTGNTGTNRCT